MVCRCVNLSTTFVITTVWFFSWMSSNMFCQVALSYKSLLTAILFTSKCVSRVASSMCLQPIRCWKLLTTSIDPAMVYLFCWPLVHEKKELLRYHPIKVFLIRRSTSENCNFFHNCEISNVMATSDICHGWHRTSTLLKRALEQDVVGSIDHFRVPKTLTFKMRPSAQPFLWKWDFFAWEWKIV